MKQRIERASFARKTFLGFFLVPPSYKGSYPFTHRMTIHPYNSAPSVRKDVFGEENKKYIFFSFSLPFFSFFFQFYFADFTIFQFTRWNICIYIYELQKRQRDDGIGGRFTIESSYLGIVVWKCVVLFLGEIIESQRRFLFLRIFQRVKRKWREARIRVSLRGMIREILSFHVHRKNFYFRKLMRDDLLFLIKEGESFSKDIQDFI